MYATPVAVGAQWSGTLDAGVARVHYQDFLPSGALLLAPAARWDGPQALFLGRAGLTRFESGNLSLHAAGSASYFARLTRAARLEVNGGASVGGHQTVGSTATALGQLRLHVQQTATSGLWIGAGAGAVELASPRSVVQGEIGAWGRIGSAIAQASLRPVAVDRLRYMDIESTVRWRRDAAELGIQAGWRWGGGDATAYARGWTAVDAALWIAPRIAIVGSAARLPADPSYGTIGGTHVSVGLRVATRPAPASLTRTPIPRATDPPGAGTLSEAVLFEVARAPGGERRLTLTIDGARQVELMGDFSDWSPIALRRTGTGRWQTTIPLSPGVYRVNVRVDGGEWQIPPGLAGVDDGFGGQVGLLVVQ